MSIKSFWVRLFQLALLLLTWPMAAQGNPEPIAERYKFFDIGPELQPLGDDFLGDSIDYHTGSISFEHRDISIAGNSDLPVEIVRQRSQGSKYHESEHTEFGDWELSVPRMRVMSLTTRPWSGARCTNYALSNFDSANPNAFPSHHRQLYARDYSDGISINVPGAGSQQILQKTNPQTWVAPLTRNSAKLTTTKFWSIECGPTASDGGEGFLAYSPEGMKYRFNQLIVRRAPDLGMIDSSARARNVYLLAATEVSDRFGNWVRYTYDGDGRLTKISSNDGRQIDVNYNGTSRLVSNIIANGRQWTYQYRRTTYQRPFWMHESHRASFDQVLTTVTRPDGRSWQFTFDAMYGTPAPSDGCGSWGSGTVSLKHPMGATATYRLDQLAHRFGTHIASVDPEECATSEPPPDGNPPRYVRKPRIPVVGVTRKTISYANATDKVWNFQYEQDDSGINTSLNDPTNWTRVVGPETHTTYYHNWTRQAHNSSIPPGQLVRKEIRATQNSPVLETVNYSYHTHDTQTGSFNSSANGNIFHETKAFWIAKEEVIRGSDVFTTDYEYGSGVGGNPYSYGRPTKVTRSSSLGGPSRQQVTTYLHNMSLWVLGLPDRQTLNGVETTNNDYTPLAQVSHVYRYGQLAGRFTYKTYPGEQGQIDNYYDALNRNVYFAQVKRGIAQSVRRPDGVWIRRIVDDNGWVTSQTDANGHRTDYSYDSMGRLARINPPGSYYVDTAISYSFPSTGGVVQTIDKGQGRTTVTYDAMVRPVLTRTQALDTGWSSYVRSEYDALGRNRFTSQPSSSATETKGVTHDYDALGRVTRQAETVAPFATTTTSYHAGHRTRTVDPSGAWTDTYRDGYGGPGGGDVIRIDETGLRNTAIARNVFGNPLSVTQSGAGKSLTQTYTYDAQQRLCRSYVPEAGSALYSYDAAGQITAYAKGQPNGASCGTIGGDDAVSLTYDLLGRVTLTDYANAGTADIRRGYDANGNLTYLGSGTSNEWRYSYNELSLVAAENLTIDGRVFANHHHYTPQASEFARLYPSGKTYHHHVDGLGRKRSALSYEPSGIRYYANHATFHPNASLASMIYGNAQQLTRTLDARQFTARQTVRKPGFAVFDLSYAYTPRGRVSGVTDHVNAGQSRQFGYDILGQLISATGPAGWGAGSYSYDRLGNLTQKTMLGRTLTYHYYASNQLSAVVSTRPSEGARHFGYDPQGNMIHKVNPGVAIVQTYTRDKAGRMKAVAEQNNMSVSHYTYDGHNRRVKSVVDGKTIYNVYLQDGTLAHVHELAHGGTPERKRDMLRMDGTLVAEVIDGDASYVHADHLGTVSARTDTAGLLSQQTYVTPYGEPDGFARIGEQELGFTGHLRDATSGLTYMQARYYDPVMGRFLSVDPVGFISSGGDPGYFNRYAYSLNDPANRIDPDGEKSFLVSRPIENTWGIANHSFVLVVDTQGTGQVHRFSYGPQGNPVSEPGQLVSHTGSNSPTDIDDQNAALMFLSDPVTASQNGVDAVTIGASDTAVIAAGEAMNERLGTISKPGENAPDYSVAAGFTSDKANSNTAAAAVAQNAINSEGGSSRQTLPAFTNNPGENKRERLED